jgi:hypothetical protein
MHLPRKLPFPSWPSTAVNAKHHEKCSTKRDFCELPKQPPSSPPVAPRQVQRLRVVEIVRGNLYLRVISRLSDINPPTKPFFTVRVPFEEAPLRVKPPLAARIPCPTRASTTPPPQWLKAPSRRPRPLPRRSACSPRPLHHTKLHPTNTPCPGRRPSASNAAPASSSPRTHR